MPSDDVVAVCQRACIVPIHFSAFPTTHHFPSDKILQRLKMSDLFSVYTIVVSTSSWNLAQLHEGCFLAFFEQSSWQHCDSDTQETIPGLPTAEIFAGMVRSRSVGIVGLDWWCYWRWWRVSSAEGYEWQHVEGDYFWQICRCHTPGPVPVLKAIGELEICQVLWSKSVSFVQAEPAWSSKCSRWGDTIILMNSQCSK